jgi:hypothetical protein
MLRRFLRIQLVCTSYDFSLTVLKTSNLLYPDNFPHVKPTCKNYLNENYFNDAAFTKWLSGQ